MSATTRDSNGQGSDPPEAAPDTPVSRRDPVIEAMQDARRRLALVEHERRQAIYAARTADGDRPSVPRLSVPPAPRVPADLSAPAAPGTPRDKLPTLDDLTDSGPVGKTARWKLALAGVAALASLAEIVRQVVGLLAR